MRARCALVLLALTPAASGCGSSEDPGAQSAPLSCSAGLEAFRGRCVDPKARYEPDARVDEDNVVAYGDPLTQLDLPEPPRSGFRIVAPPVTLEPGDEKTGCLSWPFPVLANHVIYSSRMYATPGLHHSNVLAKPVQEELGPNPYPSCHPGADDPFSDIGSGVPDVLFANSTQLTGEEDLVFPPGMGYRIDTSREISTDIHYLNTTNTTQVVEVVYDFFTMPEEALETEVAPFVMTNVDFLVPPKSTRSVEATCKVFGGNVVSLMPHTHQLIKTFSVDFVGLDGTQKNVLTQDGYDTGSDIEVYHPALDMSQTDRIHYACEFENTTDHDVVYGIGDNEMCVLFGYVYPVRSQFAAYVDQADQPCTSFQIGLLH